MRSIRRPSVTFLLWISLCLVSAGSVSAQFGQYTPPGSQPSGQSTEQGDLEEAVEEARWRVGPLRVDPWFGVRDVAFIERDGTADEADLSDFTATVGAGLRAYLPTGSRVTWAAHLLPEYVWWSDEEDRRRVNGRFGAGVFAFFNRADLQITAARADQQQVVSPEFLERVSARRDEIKLEGGVKISGGLSAFFRASQADYETVEDGTSEARREQLRLLDREERAVGAGLRWTSPRGLSLGVGVEQTEAEFEPGTLDRSNSGTSPVVEVEYQGPGLELALDLAYRSLDPEPGSVFLPFDGAVGGLRVGTTRASRVQPTLYAQRQLVFSLSDQIAYIESDRFGAALRGKVGWRTSLSGHLETGTDRYASPSAFLDDREDDLFSWGLRAELEMRENLVLTLGYTEDDYESNLPGFDRKISSFIASFTLGDRGGPWF